jgi:MFS family permease
VSVTDTSARAPAAAWYALAVLALVTFFALLDRQILMLLAEPIRRDLGLTDLQLGMVQGFGVALFAALAGLPLGWAADRFDRRLVLSVCIAWWSAAVVGAAFSNSFGSLLFSGAMVGAGEAGLAPVIYALIPMFFFGRERQLANSIAAMASVGGGALAFTAAGQIITLAASAGPGLPAPLGDLAHWRLSLLAAAAFAPLMIFLVLSIRVPRSIRPEAADQTLGVPPPESATAYFWRRRGSYLRFYLGGAMGSFAFFALSAWLAVAAARVFEQAPAQIGAAFGLSQIGSAAAGFVLSIAAIRVWGARLGPVLPVRMMWTGMVLAAVVVLSLPLASAAIHIYLVYGIAGVFLTLAAMSFPTALQNISPAHLRGRVASVQFIFAMLVASMAPPLVGAVSDRFNSIPNGVLLAVAVVAAPALVLGALLLRSCEGRVLDDLVREASAPQPETT